MKLSSPGKGIHPMNSSTLLSIWKRCFRLSFLSNQWRNPFFYKLKLKRETKQLFFPSRWTGQGKHALSTSPIAVFCRYSLFKIERHWLRFGIGKKAIPRHDFFSSNLTRNVPRSTYSRFLSCSSWSSLFTPGAEVTFTIRPPFLWTLSMIELKDMNWVPFDE